MDEKHPSGILKTEALKKYIYETYAYPKENEQLRELREATEDKYGNEWRTVSVMLMKITNAKKTIEIGVFTGYSLLSTALALPDDGQILAIDCLREAFDFGFEFIKKAGMDRKINFVHSPGLTVLDQMLKDGTHKAEFDFAFVDSDKSNYLNYHERLLKLVKVGGIIAYDDTLWYGFVAEEEESVPETPDYWRLNRKHLMDFNRRIACDPRVDVSQVAAGHGITLCRRIV